MKAMGSLSNDTKMINWSGEMDPLMPGNQRKVGGGGIFFIKKIREKLGKFMENRLNRGKMKLFRKCFFAKVLFPYFVKG